MEDRFTILKKEKFQDYFSILIGDKKERKKFWVDCSLIDGYGNRENFKTDDLYIDWEFNQYIFNLDYEEDIQAKKYQETADNVDALGYFIDDINKDLVDYFLKKEGK